VRANLSHAADVKARRRAAALWRGLALTAASTTAVAPQLRRAFIALPERSVIDLVTILTACALGFKAQLFIPLGVLDNCIASFRLGTAVAPQNGSPTIDRWAAYIAEAARRFGRPEAWVRAVMQAESRGVADATSPAGAIGLMQIMPETYAGLRVRYGLGADAYDPHDNIIAGTAYISEMIELFGVPNFLAAYNAGPARLEDHLQRGRPLPEETQRYLAQIGELPVGVPPSSELPAPQSLPFETAASTAPRSSPQTTTGSASARRMIDAPIDEPQHRRPKKSAASNELFAPKWSNPSATPPPSTKPPSDRDVGTGFALFVPLGRDPMRLSANTPSSHPE
jgi:soluble lytic murein transglycosylase-like protein